MGWPLTMQWQGTWSRVCGQANFTPQSQSEPVPAMIFVTPKHAWRSVLGGETQTDLLVAAPCLEDFTFTTTGSGTRKYLPAEFVIRSVQMSEKPLNTSPRSWTRLKLQMCQWECHVRAELTRIINFNVRCYVRLWIILYLKPDMDGYVFTWYIHSIEAYK